MDGDEKWKSARVEDLPVLHKPGQDVTLRRYRIGGGDDRTDRRIIFDRAGMDLLHRLAEGSLTGRVVLDGASLTIEVRQASDGHVYEVWTFAGAPRAENSMLDEIRQVRR